VHFSILQALEILIYWTKHHPESHHRNIQKEFLTPTIVLEMLQIEQQLQRKVARAAWK
jgi:hypothetical protein